MATYVQPLKKIKLIDLLRDLKRLEVLHTEAVYGDKELSISDQDEYERLSNQEIVIGYDNEPRSDYVR